MSSLNARIDAASAAIAAHTIAFGIDDDGDPAGIGAWHLLYSLYGYCEQPGMFPLDTIANTPQDWSFGKPFLVRVEAATADGVRVSEPKEYEVSAESVDEACRKAAGQSPWMRSDVERRTTHEFRTEKYIEPDWNAYAGGAIIREGDRVSLKNGLASAIETGWMPRSPELEFTRPGDGGRLEPVEAAAFAIEVYKKVAGEEGDDRIRDVENLLRGLREYLARFGEDFHGMLDNVREERASIEYAGSDPDEEEGERLDLSV